jgi:hypothetical protein
MAQKWEYTLVDTRDLSPERVVERLNELGNEGWEYVGTIDGQVDNVLLRRLREPDESAGSGWQNV